MLPVSKKIREAIILHKNNNKTNEDISKWLLVSTSTVTRIWALYKKTGTCDPKPQNSGRKARVSQETMTKVVERIKKTPDITLQEMVELFNLPISISALSRKLKKLGYTFKKRLCFQQPKNEKM